MAEYLTERFIGDLEILAPLLIPDADVKTTTRELQWKCRETPHGPGAVWVIRFGDEVAAMATMYRRNLLLGHDEVPGALHADLVVSPNHRRKGLATRILSETFVEAAKAGYAIAFGFPNTVSLPAQRAAGGWTELGTIHEWSTAPSRVFALPRRVAVRLPGALGRGAAHALERLAMLRGPAPLRAHDFDVTEEWPTSAEYDAFWGSIRAAGAFMAVRDHAWLDWRFRRKPNYRCTLLFARRDGALHGFLALNHRRTAAGLVTTLLVDALALEPAAYAALFDLAVVHARLARAVQLFFPRVGPVGPSSPFDVAPRDTNQVVFVRALRPDLVGGRMPAPDRWSFTFADSDV